MRIFFSMQHLGSFLTYEPVVRELASRGHEIHLAISRAEALGWDKTLERVLADHPGVTWSWLSPSPDTAPSSFELARTIRVWVDYLRYFSPDYAFAPKLLARAEEGVPPGLVRLSRKPAFKNPVNRRRLLAALWSIERSLPHVAEIRNALRRHKPDLVLVTPLIYLGSWQFEVLRTALAQGLRTAFCVGSWDHLSSKALIRDMPHRVFVWNETQKEEAIRFHGVPADRITVTGAQCFDQWFGRVPVRSREEFCRRVGLPADRSLILYVCSALFWGSPVEAEFVQRWVRSLRESAHPELRSAAILVRPHPARMDEWKSIELSAFDNVALYGSNPQDAVAKEDYFESLFYSHAVVGLNTSAFLEASVVGRPVHSILTPEFAENQQGTLHFHYLLNVGGGVLQTSRTFEEHHAQIVRSMQHPYDRTATIQQFVREFVRPHGLATPATPVFCDAVDALLRAPAPQPETTPFRFVLLRWAVMPIFLLLQRIFGAELFRDDWRRHDREHQLLLEARERERQARRRSAEETKRRRAERWAGKAAAREAAVQAARAERERVTAEKARRAEAKAWEKTARARKRQRAAVRARLKDGAHRWLSRFRRQGQAT
jgi:hypothetical protein